MPGSQTLVSTSQCRVRSKGREQLHATFTAEPTAQPPAVLAA